MVRPHQTLADLNARLDGLTSGDAWDRIEMPIGLLMPFDEQDFEQAKQVLRDKGFLVTTASEIPGCPGTGTLLIIRKTGD